MIKDTINEYGSRINRAFDQDRSKTVGASEIGLCARRVAWTKRGTLTDAQAEAEAVLSRKAKGRSDPRSEKSKKSPRSMAGSVQVNWGAHVRGSAIEAHLWVPAMRARFGKNFVLAGEEQQTLTLGTLSATPDGVVADRGHEILKALGVPFDPRKTSRDVVVECKSIDPRVNLVEEKEENAFQVQVQMGLLRELTDYKPDWAVISYVDASFWHEVVEFPVPFRPEDYEAAKMRSAMVLRADPSDLKPEGWITGGKECGWCPWGKRCAEMRGSVPEDEASKVDDQFRAEILDLCKRYNALQTKAKKDSEAMRDVQNQIKDRLREKGIRKIPGLVNWFNVKGRESWDVEAMLKELQKRKVPIGQFSTVGEPSNSLVVDKKVALL